MLPLGEAPLGLAEPSQAPGAEHWSGVRGEGFELEGSVIVPEAESPELTLGEERGPVLPVVLGLWDALEHRDRGISACLFVFTARCHVQVHGPH